MKRTFVARGAIALGLLALAAAASAEKLKLGNEGTYPPFSIMSADGKLSGLEPDLAREMCQRMAVECEIVAMDFSALLPSLIAGKIDMIVSQLTPLPERLEATEFTIPVILNPTGFVVAKSWDEGWDDQAFADQRIGVYKGSSHAKFIENERPSATPVYFENNDQMQLDLLAGRIDAVFGAKINWQLTLIDKPEGADWKLSPDIWDTGEKYGMSWAAQKGETELVERANQALRSIIDDCTYTNIRKKYIELQLLDEESKCL